MGPAALCTHHPARRTVQAAPEDKKRAPGCWRTYAYELALVTASVVAEDASKPRPAHVPPPATLEMGPPPAANAAWRCLSCYQTRFKTMCFGQNPAGSAVCQHCTLAPVKMTHRLEPFLEPSSKLC